MFAAGKHSLSKPPTYLQVDVEALTRGVVVQASTTDTKDTKTLLRLGLQPVHQILRIKSSRFQMGKNILFSKFFGSLKLFGKSSSKYKIKSCRLFWRINSLRKLIVTCPVPLAGFLANDALMPIFIYCNYITKRLILPYFGFWLRLTR